MRRGLAVAALMPSFLLATAGHAGVSVHIGIDLPGPPELVPVPGTAVLYAPAVPANYFFYAGQYYAFEAGVWYVGPGYNGPWGVVAPELVPRPILAVPVRYYRVPPPAWHAWRRETPPHWEPQWGRRWVEHGRPIRATRVHARRREERR